MERNQALQVLAVMLFVCGACAGKSRSERHVNPAHQAHHELPDADAVVFPVGSPWRQLSASVQVQPDQQDGGVIELTLELLNESTSAIRIRDPLDTFLIDVLDPDGWPIAVPFPPSRLQLNPEPFEPLERPYTVLRAHNSLGRDLMAQLKTPELTLDPGSAHWIDLELDRVPLGKGEHSVRFSLVLLPVSGTEHKMCVSQMIQVRL